MEDGCGQGSCDCWSWFSLVLRGFKARLVSEGFRGGKGLKSAPCVSLLPVSASSHLQLEAHAHLMSSGVEVLRVDQSGQSEFHTCRRYSMYYASLVLLWCRTKHTEILLLHLLQPPDSTRTFRLCSWTRRSKQAFIEGLNTLVSHTESE